VSRRRDARRGRRVVNVWGRDGVRGCGGHGGILVTAACSEKPTFVIDDIIYAYAYAYAYVYVCVIGCCTPAGRVLRPRPAATTSSGNTGA
jgi:hypothetical protein